MPELPDVEAFRKVLASCARDAVIQRVDVYDAGVLHGVSVRRLREQLRGRVFGAPRRHGKWLVAPTERAEGGRETEGTEDAEGGEEGEGAEGGAGDGAAVRAEARAGTLPGAGTLLWHFGMTGELVCCAAGERMHAHDRVVFTLAPRTGADGPPAAGTREPHDPRKPHELRYRDQRKLQGLWLVDAAGLDRMLADQGPDAAAVSRAEFDAALAGRRGGLKPTLTDQSVLAGLGNLLTDEILWQARLNPSVRVHTLSDAQRDRLYTGMRRTLTATVRAGRVPARETWLTGHRGSDDPHCPRCGATLRLRRVAGRGTVWCPRCQA